MTVTALLALPSVLWAQYKTEVNSFNLTGPYAVSTPLTLDTVDVQGRKFDDKSLLSAIPLEPTASKVFTGQVLPSLSGSRGVGLLTFYVNNSDYLKESIQAVHRRHRGRRGAEPCP